MGCWYEIILIIKERYGMNDVWLKMAEFLGRLNGESVSRESYVRTPEYEKAWWHGKKKNRSGRIFWKLFPQNRGKSWRKSKNARRTFLLPKS